MQKVFTSYILLGSNLGDSFNIFKEAITQISLKCGVILQKSSLYKTQAWGVEKQQDYLNQVIIIETTNSPEILLNKLLEIEKEFGRERKQQWAARTLDLDILFYEQQIIETFKLIIPHPRLHLRNFTLIPLQEISPNYIHPVLNKKITTLLEECEDNLAVERIFTK